MPTSLRGISNDHFLSHCVYQYLTSFKNYSINYEWIGPGLQGEFGGSVFRFWLKPNWMG